MDKRKQLRAEYEARSVTGGIIKITNKENGRFVLQSTDDITGSRNRFRFAVLTNTSLMPSMNADWVQYGAEAFELEELELLEKKASQTNGEFTDDLAVLLDFWDEKLPREIRYNK